MYSCHLSDVIHPLYRIIAANRSVEFNEVPVTGVA